jgi:group I intron endonuclease
MSSKKYYTVYILKFPNGKVYIGETSRNPMDRWRGGEGYKHSIKVYNAIKKYGWEVVIPEIIENGLTKSQAEFMEIDLIKKYKSNQRGFGYNISNGGRTLGSMSDETKKKLSIINTGKHHSQETKDKLSKINMGKKQSKETIAKRVAKITGQKRPTVSIFMSKRIGKKHPNFGKKRSEESKKKQSETMRNLPKGKLNTNGRPVIQYSKDLIFIRRWETAKLASIELQIGVSHIGDCCKGKRYYKTAGNYVWKYETEKEK